MIPTNLKIMRFRFNDIQSENKKSKKICCLYSRHFFFVKIHDKSAVIDRRANGQWSPTHLAI